MTITIYEYADNASSRSGEKMSGELNGRLATDELGLAVKVITVVPGVANDIQLTSRTRVVKLVADASTPCRYRFRTRQERNRPVALPSAAALTPSATHPLLAASTSVYEPTYSGSVVSILGV